MKKLVALFILSFHLFSATALHELTKIPVLFLHYFEHKSLNEQITFVKYLVDHYNSIPHTDNDEDRDNQLPFKSPDKGGYGHSSLAIPHFHHFTIKFPAPTVKKFTSLHSEDHIPASYQGKIWQPPKV